MQLQNTFSEYIKSFFFTTALYLYFSMWAFGAQVISTRTHAGHTDASALFLSLIRMVSLMFSDSQAIKHISQWQVWEQSNLIVWYGKGIFSMKSRRHCCRTGHVIQQWTTITCLACPFFKLCLLLGLSVNMAVASRTSASGLWRVRSKSESILGFVDYFFCLSQNQKHKCERNGLNRVFIMDCKQQSLACSSN